MDDFEVVHRLQRNVAKKEPLEPRARMLRGENIRNIYRLAKSCVEEHRLAKENMAESKNQYLQNTSNEVSTSL